MSRPMPDWEPAPPSARLKDISVAVRYIETRDARVAGWIADDLCAIAADVDAMERDLAKLRAALAHRDGLDARLREERADG